VKDAILSEVEADAFMVQRRPITMSEEEEERTRSFPRVTLDDADAIRRFSPLVKAVMAAAATPARPPTGSTSSRPSASPVSRGDYVNFMTYKVAQDGSSAPARSTEPAGGSARWDAADRLFKGVDPIDKIIKIEGSHFRVVASPRRRERSSASHRTSSRWFRSACFRRSSAPGSRSS